jgi:putative ABC transport system permease protein
MQGVRIFLARLRALFSGQWPDRELTVEIDSHLEQLAEQHRSRGLSPADARAAARRDFGGVDQTKEAYREQRRLPLVESAAQDVRYALRSLRRAPGFAVSAILVLALGIGANATLFSLVDAALLRPLPFREPDRLVMVFERAPQFQRNFVAPRNFADWREQNHTFASLAGFSIGASVMLLDAAGNPDTVPAQNVTPAFFDVLGVTPIAGRTFVAGDETPQPNVVVISERVWKTRFGGDPGLVGRQIPLGNQQVTVIGIVPASFKFIAESDFWILFAPPERTPAARRQHFIRVVGRMKPGVSIETARADLAVVADDIARVAPDTNQGWGVTIDPLHPAIVGDELRTTTLVLSGVVVFVLLLACANVANLLLARGVGRAQELAVRAALGGSRARLVRLLLTENLVLGGYGGIGGVALAWVGVRVAPSFIPGNTIPAGIAMTFDARLVAFSMALTTLTILASGLVPAIYGARLSLVEVMTASGRSATARSGRFRRILTVVEIAAALLLVTGAGLLTRTILSLDSVAAGYRGDRVVTMSVGLEFLRYPTSKSRFEVFHAIEGEVARVPGVQAASLATDLPIGGFSFAQGFAVAGDASPDSARLPLAHYQMIGSLYFDVLGIPLVQGRAFAERDTPDSAPVCIVNEEFVRRYLRDRNPIGARIVVRTMAVPPMPVEREIVGVSRQVKERPGVTENQIEIFVPASQNSWYATTIAAKTAVDPTGLVPAIKAAVARVRRDLPVTRVRTLDDVAAESTARPRFRAQLVGAFAALAMVLAAVGIFSVFTFTVQQRRREFSIRLALGAGRGNVVRHVVGDAGRLIGVGIAIGAASASVLARSMSSLLFGVRPFDPATFAGAAALLGAVAVMACAFPAVRAASSDPATALKSD